MEDKEDKKRKQ